MQMQAFFAGPPRISPDMQIMPLRLVGIVTPRRSTWESNDATETVRQHEDPERREPDRPLGARAYLHDRQQVLSAALGTGRAGAG